MTHVRIADLLPTVGAERALLDLERVERFRRQLDRLPPVVVVFQTPDGLLRRVGQRSPRPHRLRVGVDQDAVVEASSFRVSSFSVRAP